MKRGERPTIEEYTALHPELAEEILAIFPAIRIVADLGPSLDDRTQEAARTFQGSVQSTAEFTDDSPDATLIASADSSRPSRRPAPKVAGYEILGELGRGGMGVVYKALHQRLDRVVALKMVLAGDHANPEMLGRFHAEAVAAAKVQHRNVVQIFHVDEHEGLPFFEMEFVAGGSLADRLIGEPMPPRESARLVEELARGVSEAHRLNVVHRDLKPSNVLLAGDGTPKVADFGLAKILGVDSEATRTNSIIGSPCYMAPEQAEGKARDAGPTADVYAMGAILYELLTGRPPFRGATILETLDQVKNSEPVPPSRLVPAVPRDLETIALKAIAKEPGRRYPSAHAMAEDLGRYLEGKSILARPVSVMERSWRWCRRRPAVAGLLTALIAAIAGGFAGMARLTLIAEESAEVAGRNEREAQRLAKAEVATRVASQHREADLSLSKGIALAEQHYVGRGLLWMAEALRVAPREAEELRGVIRRNFTSWQGRLIVPTSILPTGPSRALAFSPDGRVLATGGDDGRLRLWDFASGKELASTLAHRGEIGLVIFRPDGRSLASCGSIDGAVRLWSADGLRPRGEFLSGTRVQPASAEFAPDGRTLLTVFNSKHVVQIWDVDSGRQIVSIVDCPDARAGRYSPDGRFVLLFGGKAAQVWSPANGKAVGNPVWCTAPIEDAAFSADGRSFGIVAARPSDEGLRKVEYPSFQYRDIGSQSEAGPAITDHPAFNCLALHPDGRRMVASGLDYNVRTFDLKTGHQIGATMPHLGRVAQGDDQPRRADRPDHEPGRDRPAVRPRFRPAARLDPRTRRGGLQRRVRPRWPHRRHRQPRRCRPGLGHRPRRHLRGDGGAPRPDRDRRHQPRRHPPGDRQPRRQGPHL